MTFTADAPAKEPDREFAATQVTVSWWWLVAASVTVLVAVAVTLFVWWLATRETRTTTYRVLGDLAAVQLDLGDADVEIDGGASAVEIRRVDRFAFGRPSQERHTLTGGHLDVVSRCPDQVLGSCHASYHVTVPDNVPVMIETGRGTVDLSGVRASVEVSTGSGAITATGFCGFSLRASSDAGDVSAVSECSADRLELRSRTGDVRAVVPVGRYEVDAQSDSGTTRIRGLTVVDDAPFQVQALSTSGDVSVEAAS
jgi:hypothetical protein